MCGINDGSLFDDVIFPGASRVRSNSFGLVAEELVYRFAGAWPALVTILVEHDCAARLNFIVEHLQRELVGIVEIAVEMQECDAPLVRGQGLVKPPLHQADSLADDRIAQASVVQEFKHGIWGGAQKPLPLIGVISSFSTGSGKPSKESKP